MRPVRLTVDATAGPLPQASPPIPIDIYLDPTNIGFQANVDGTVTYTVESTLDDVFAEDFDPDTATWIPHPTIDGETATMQGNFAFPPSAVRIVITAGTGSVDFTLIQAGAIS